ncbi:MAG: hypothetical protein PHY16_18200 [Methylobacter sp.]|nr:hypothetical protein [Methylobacter sp.]
MLDLKLLGFCDANNLFSIRRGMFLNKTGDPLNGLFQRVGLGANIAAGYRIIGIVIQEPLND